MKPDLRDKLQRCSIDRRDGSAVLTLISDDGANILSSAVVASLRDAIDALQIKAEAGELKGLIITGNDKFFSAGADLNEIAQLTGPAAFDFSRRGQLLTDMVDRFPVPVIAAVRGYCMGGGMDLALACDFRIAAPTAVFGHRGASLGLITGWGGTQRLSRLIGKSRALQMFLLAEMVNAEDALEICLVDQLDSEPVQAALKRIATLSSAHLL